MEDLSRTFTITEVVRQSPITVSECAVRRAIRDGRLPAKLVFGKWRINPADFADYMYRRPAKTQRSVA